ncbi:uncharacterized protein PG998_010349 [Apiospora kogelbergensis]|uniref:uncharacterized protein n=1 Tax=Apiospora kogelbergensis TaxID=1337665 RepID=UPI00312F9BF3
MSAQSRPGQQYDDSINYQRMTASQFAIFRKAQEQRRREADYRRHRLQHWLTSLEAAVPAPEIKYSEEPDRARGCGHRDGDLTAKCNGQSQKVGPCREATFGTPAAQNGDAALGQTWSDEYGDATHNIKTVPAEVSDEVKRFGVKLPLEAVREPAPANPPFTNVVPKPFEQDDTALAARDVLQDLCTILQDTRESVALKRHEDVWNHLTHGLILRLGFRSHAAFLHSWHHDPSKPRYSVRCESVMNATIDGGCITKMKGSGPPGPACHMETIVASDGTVLQVCAPESLLTPEHSTSSHNKVDFILALNMAEETPLRRTVDELDKHVNQTAP